MKHNKSPGLDGLPVEFYIVFWKDISDMLIDSFNFSLQNGLMSSSQRNGVITLIPKKDRDASYLKNFRPISLLTVDYKILAKTLANRVKKILSDLIHPDQSGFLKGRNIGNNVRLIIDIIEYTESEQIPGAILLLDIQKAFDSVSHDFLCCVLRKFNFSNEFIDWIKVFYSGRKSYVSNYGNLTRPLNMERGIFQGCPISPYLFLLVIESMALAIRQNPNIQGIPVAENELKISLLADDSTCFIDGSDNSFKSLFDTIGFFSESSGCKLNISKSEAIWIGSLKGCQRYPFCEKGLKWNKFTFKTLGIHFSLTTDHLYDLNHKIKLKSIENTLNCWRARNLSLVGKICVVKTLLLPQVLYFFSVLCIKIPKKFFRQLNTILYKFIWNGGSDRVKRRLMCNDYSLGGLKMIDPYTFSIAQKMSWVKMLLDDKYQSVWKSIEMSILNNFSSREDILWKAYAPQSILNKLGSCQLAESLQTWYIFRENFAKTEFGTVFSAIGSCQCIWFNRNICSKSKHYFLYEDWLDKGIVYISDLLNPPHPGNKLFEELILDYDIGKKDRRKYNFLLRNIPNDLLVTSDLTPDKIFDDVKTKLLKTLKIPKYAYSTMLESCSPERQILFWNDLQEPDEVDWEKTHVNNFKCTISTRIRSFYFKLFHRAIGLNEFLYKIKRKVSPNCSFCNTDPETYSHIFVECPNVKPIWDETVKAIIQKTNKPLNPTKPYPAIHNGKAKANQPPGASAPDWVFFTALSAAKACFVPYVSIYLRQLGLSAMQVGVILGCQGCSPASLLLVAFREVVTRPGIDVPFKWISSTFWLPLLVVVITGTFAGPIEHMCDTALYHQLDNIDELDKYKRPSLLTMPVFAAMALVSALVVDSTACFLYGNASHMAIHFYLSAAFIGVVFLVGIIVPLSHKIKNQQEGKYIKSIKFLYSDGHTAVMCVTLVVTAMISSCSDGFLFWLIQDLHGLETTMGVSLAVAFMTELPMSMIFTPWLVQKLGNVWLLALGTACLGLQNLYYSVLWTPWAVVPIQLLHALGRSAIRGCILAFLNEASPPGMGKAIQVTVLALEQGVGMALGSILWGVLYGILTVKLIFVAAAIMALVWTVVLIICACRLPTKKRFMYAKLLQSDMEMDMKGGAFGSDSEDNEEKQWLHDAIRDEDDGE
eukprot:XP_011680762.1 PREDICTED: uncharacterized protein LOC583642 [Strongylocentrotus purpuratus]